MIRFLLVVLSLLTICFSVSADSGGPDIFGYTWIDSNEPGGPSFAWIDITAVGDSITGLSDDVCVGPYLLGFPLTYYWYEVNELYIGSNGYVTFGSPQGISQPFPVSIPLNGQPNDFIGIYMADWFPGNGGQGSVYFWTNHLDSCVVSFLDIPAYITAGSHTFQLILTNSDSSITFQYAEQQGLVMNNDLLIGIESQTGQAGLEHSHDQYIAFDNSAVKYTYPDEITYQVRDLAASAVANNISGGFFNLPGSYFHPWALVKNVGIQTESGYSLNFNIIRQNGFQVYDETMYPLFSINPGEDYENYFLPMWVPDDPGQYFVSCIVTHEEDMNVHNDTIRTECHVMELPGTMLYDDGSAELAWRWEGGFGGLAQRFVPPEYYAKVDSVSLYIAEDGGTTPFTLELLDDDGIGGSPGSVLFVAEQNASTAGFYSFDLSTQNIIVEDGAFYVAWHMGGEGTAGIGLDRSADQLTARQSWEYTGVWNPFRQRCIDEVMIRCSISLIAPPNRPPQIIDYSPAYLDTVINNAGNYTFWASAIDPDGDNLSWEWIFEGQVIGSDSIVSVPISANGFYQLFCWVSDSQLEDSISWNIEGLLPVIDDGEEGRPYAFNLHPVYPNPFNPETVICFDLPRMSNVRLSVYDLFGREITILADGRYPPGQHSVVLHASQLSSGLYFIKLDAGSAVFVQKAIILK